MVKKKKRKNAVQTPKHVRVCHTMMQNTYSASRCHSCISSLNIAVLARQSTPFDTIMASVIVCLTDLVNYHPFLSCLMRRARGYEGFYSHIIFTEFFLRSILSIAP